MGCVYGLCMTVRAIFAHHVSTLMHRSNRPVQARPGGRCVGRAYCVASPVNENTVGVFEQ
jgi:hypothetical protein